MPVISAKVNRIKEVIDTLKKSKTMRLKSEVLAYVDEALSLLENFARAEQKDAEGEISKATSGRPWAGKVDHSVVHYMTQAMQDWHRRYVEWKQGTGEEPKGDPGSFPCGAPPYGVATDIGAHVTCPGCRETLWKGA